MTQKTVLELVIVLNGYSTERNGGNKMARKKVISVALAAMMTFSSVWGSSAELYGSVLVKAQNTTQTKNENIEMEVVSDASTVNASSYGLCDNTKDGAILHAFCWSFNTIKENMEDIAASGYTTVQTSPINECNATHSQMKLYDPSKGTDYDGSNGCWWWHYQPTDWTIGNYQLGSRDEYIAMCKEADKYGVKIISDVLPNHTTPDLSQVSSSLASAAGGMSAGQLYHSNGFNEIGNYSDRTECTTGQMSGLPDVNTENQGFQAYYLKFCNDVIDCGGDGFRYDTAKHIGVPSDPKDPSNTRGVNDFWDVATGKTSVNGVKLNKPDNFFIYGEVLQDNGIPYSEYASYMNMTASSYGYVLRDSNLKNNSLNAGGLQDWCHSTPDKIVTWVESHDTYCNHHASAWLNDFQIRAGWAVIAARANGTPLFFSRPAGSNGSSGNYWGNNVLGAAGNDQFKHPEVAACNHFRNAMVGESEYMSNPNGNSSVLVIERGTKGAVIINMGSSVSNISLSKVADGTYTEEVSGQTVQVSGGTLNYTVPGGSIAVVYDANVTKAPTVTASKDSGNFTEAFELTLTPMNATKATYSIDGGDAVEFTKATKVTIGENAQVGDKITVKVTAEGEGDAFSKTFTYTMVDTPDIPEAKVYVRVSKSDFSTAPYAYVYQDGATAKELNGGWPGNAMTEEGDYYVYYTNEVDSANVIFSYDGIQDPASQQPGYEVSGYMEYTKGSGVKAFTPAPKKTPTPKPEATDTPAPEATDTPSPTSTVKVTDKPTIAPTTAPWASVSVENGSSFTTETLDVKITLNGATEGTYSVDNGPEKSFKSGDTVTLGQGKIADTEVTLKVSATIDKATKTNTFTYKKVFDANTAPVKASAVKKIQSIFEVVAEAAQVNGAAETEAYYATNPDSKVGKEATITGMSDFTQDMLVARSGAWDVPNAFHGAHENSVADCYGLYAAWDDTNLYIGLEMVNTTDTWAQGGDGPLSDGGKMSDVPVVIAINTGKGNAMTGKCPTDKEGHIWQCNLEFETRIDHLLFASAKGTGNPGLFTADADGNSDYTEHLVGFKDAGITYVSEDGSISPEIMHIKGPEQTSDVYDSSKYVDAMTQNHDRKYDTFYTYTIPLKALNIDKSYIESNGIGIMGFGTRQTSALDCIPHDPSMLDNTMLDYTLAQDNTSHEKEDLDVITVPLAAVGNVKGSGEGGSSVVTPTKTTAPTATPTVTTGVKETTAPTETATTAPTATAEVTATPTAEPVVTTAPTATSGVYTVNFGADRSSPQYDSTALTLKAIGYGSKDYKYEFSVDGIVVQESSEKDSYSWKGTAGTHTIKVVVTDSEGKKRTSEKTYVIEQDPSATPTVAPTNVPVQLPTTTPVVTATPEVTKEPVITEAPTATPVVEPLNLTFKTGYKSPTKAGTTIPLSLIVTGGKAPYSYEIRVQNSSGKSNVLLCSDTKNTVKWTPSKAGKYTLTGKVIDATGRELSAVGTYTISNPINVKTFKLSKSSVKKGKKVKITAKATSSDTVKYQFRLRKVGSKTYTTIRKYSKTGTFNWKANKKKGKYYIYLTVKDADGHTKSVKKKITIK